ncbi:MAG: flagellar hook-length control protein FliK [Caldimonas sp.]|uniref:flagellar hook-length control protein FliK n=1 Tax=Caldimonas sp. TaxID=2838790 RepID=UPI003918B13A
MTVTALPFAPAAASVGATPPARNGSTRADAAADFGHWLQRAQPSAPASRPLPASTHHGPNARPAPPPHEARQSSSDPAPERPDRASDGRPASAPSTTQDEPERDEPTPAAAGGELPAPWWWMTPEAPAVAADATAALDRKDGLALAAPDQDAKAGTRTPTSGLLEPMSEPPIDSPAVAPAGDTDAALLVAQTPPSELDATLMAAPAPQGLHSAEAPGASPVPWLAGSAPPVPAAGGASTAAAPAPGTTLATPVHDPDFPDALAQHITVLTRQGVQEAQLHLNPADMGPVNVHIAVSGQQAHVEFTASASATRAALEASFSHLAAALHEAGLTLTGGGVSRDAMPRRQADDLRHGPGPHRGDDRPADAASGLRPRAAPLPGRLDLYA